MGVRMVAASPRAVTERAARLAGGALPRSSLAAMETLSRRDGARYVVADADREKFVHDGYVHLPGVLAEEEVRAIEAVYAKFMSREIAVPGKDFCDMSGDYTRTLE